MRNILLMFLLAVISGTVSADWKAINKGPTASMYIDLSTRQTSSRMVKMWHLTDNYAPKTIDGGKTFTSLKAQIEYDCDKKQTRYLWTTVYSGHMANGEMVDSLAGNQKWQPVIPGTVWEILWKSACLNS